MGRYAKVKAYLQWLATVDEDAWIEGQRILRWLRKSESALIHFIDTPVEVDDMYWKYAQSGGTDPERFVDIEYPVLEVDQCLVDVDHLESANAESLLDVDYPLLDVDQILVDVDYSTEPQVCLLPSYILPLLPNHEESCDEPRNEEELPKESDDIARDVPRSLLPYQVKAIPEDFERPMVIFKYGVLAKWHKEVEEVSSGDVPFSTPPVCCGGEAQPSVHQRRERYGPEVCDMLFNHPFCILSGVQEDEWVKPWSIHSGRFKVLDKTPPTDPPRFPPPEEPPDPPIPPAKDEPG
jgi:hypothetical protein